MKILIFDLAVKEDALPKKICIPTDKIHAFTGTSSEGVMIIYFGTNKASVISSFDSLSRKLREA